MANVLLHIGFPKAGSTYLQNWYSTHSSIFYKRTGVAGFLSDWDIARYAESEGDLHKWFVLSSEDLSVWAGRMNIVTLENKDNFDVKQYQTKLADTLYALYPNAKVLICTRGFEAILHSMYNQNVSIGGIHSFQEFSRKFNQFLAESYDYTFTIELYKNRFGNNTIVLPMELLRDDSKKFISIIEDALGIEHEEFSSKAFNASVDKNLLYTYLKVSGTIHFLLSILPYSYRWYFFKKYSTMLRKEKPHRLMKALRSVISGNVDLTITRESIMAFKNNSTILLNNPLYTPYLKEYLLE
jgi:RNA binding exosome subunit